MDTKGIDKKDGQMCIDTQIIRQIQMDLKLKKYIINIQLDKWWYKHRDLNRYTDNQVDRQMGSCIN